MEDGNWCSVSDWFCTRLTLFLIGGEEEAIWECINLSDLHIFISMYMYTVYVFTVNANEFSGS